MADSYPTEIHVNDFAANTPSVPAERISCSDCGDVYVGDPDNEHVCPSCKVGQ